MVLLAASPIIATQAVNPSGVFNVAFACEVIPPGPPREELDKAEAVFSGKVTEIQRGTKDSYGDIQINAIFFDVEKYWKSPESFKDYRSLVVFSQLSGDVCGYEFEEGKEYLVYAWTNERDGSLHTGIGTRTQLLENAPDLVLLGEGIEPTTEVRQEELIKNTTFVQLPTHEEAQFEGATPSIMRFIYPIGIGAAIAAIIAFITLRRRK